MAAKKNRNSQIVQVEDLDFNNLFVTPVQNVGYMTQKEASRAKRDSAKLREIDSVFKDMQSEFSNLQDKKYQDACLQCLRSIDKKEDIVHALGKRFHPKCFNCEKCNKNLVDNPYIEHAGKIYCLQDHAKEFGAKCASCKQLITEKIVFALGTTWHTEHLKCEACKQVLGPGFVERDGKAYCQVDFARLFAIPCGGCGHGITSEYHTFLGKKWHSDCYKCQTCRTPFSTGPAYPFETKPYCEYHFHEKNGTLCGGCTRPINGPCVRALNKAWHPDCFRCAVCKVKISDEYFPENGKPHCALHGN